LPNEDGTVGRTDEVGGLRQRGHVHEVAPRLTDQPLTILNVRVTHLDAVRVGGALVAECRAVQIHFQARQQRAAVRQVRVGAEDETRLFDVRIEVRAFAHAADRNGRRQVKVPADAAVGDFAVVVIGPHRVQLDEAAV
jgi:hypothetical protein